MSNPRRKARRSKGFRAPPATGTVSPLIPLAIVAGVLAEQSKRRRNAERAELEATKLRAAQQLKAAQRSIKDAARALSRALRGIGQTPTDILRERSDPLVRTHELYGPGNPDDTAGPADTSSESAPTDPTTPRKPTP